VIEEGLEAEVDAAIRFDDPRDDVLRVGHVAFGHVRPQTPPGRPRPARPLRGSRDPGVTSAPGSALWYRSPSEASGAMRARSRGRTPVGARHASATRIP